MNCKDCFSNILFVRKICLYFIEKYIFTENKMYLFIYRFFLPTFHANKNSVSDLYLNTN